MIDLGGWQQQTANMQREAAIKMGKPANWKQQLVDSRGQPIYQPFSEPGIYALGPRGNAAPITKHWRSALARRRLDLAVAEHPLTVTI
jgi:hypothetical protein